MPVLVNAQSGLAEDLPQESADQAVASGSHHLPLNDPEGNPVTAPHAEAANLLAQGYTQPSPEQLKNLLGYSKYSGTGEQIKTGLEGAASAATFGLSTGVERALGVDPEDIRGREEVNPGVHAVGEVAGLAASSLIPVVGEANVLREAGVGAKALTGLGKEGASIASKAAASAVQFGVETALMQGGNEISKFISENPDQSAETAIANIGISGILGGAGGAIFGAVPELWRAKNAGKVEQAIADLQSRAAGDVSDSSADEAIKTIQKAGVLDRLSAPKENAKQVMEIAQRNGWPLPSGITSGSKEVQQAVDSLLNGPPTLSSIAMRKEYAEAAGAATNSVESAIRTGSDMSESQMGKAVQQSLTSKLESEYEPIKQLYSDLEGVSQRIPVGDKSTKSISRNILKLVDEHRLIRGTPEYNFVQTMAEGLDQVTDLDGLKNFRTALGRASGPDTKFVAGLIREKLDNLEENSIRRFAETMKTPVAKEKILSTLDQVGEAKAAYKEFRGKLSTLGKALGKSRFAGPQDFTDFVESMNPQKLARAVFNENNVQFAQFFAKEFPEEMQQVAQYQRSEIARSAMSSGVFDPKKALKQALSLEPEMQRLVFSPEEISRLNDAQTYLQSFPKSFNPSGTAHEGAFRSFFEHPAQAALANIRDFAMQGFIKALGHAAPGAEASADTLVPLLGKSATKMPPNAEAFKNAVDFAMAAIKGENTMGRAAKAVFKPGAEVIPGHLHPTEASRDKLKKRVDDVAENPEGLLNVGGLTGHYMPDHAQAVAQTSARVTQYLSSLKPSTEKLGPLDPERKPSRAEVSRYNRALDIAEQPAVVLESLKNGTLTQQDVTDLKAMYPGWHARVSQKLMGALVDHHTKGETIPYKTRMAVSNFIGQPLDASMQPQAILAAQPQAAQPAPQMQQPGTGSHHGSMKALGKASIPMQTPMQGRETRRLMGRS
jgi:hypothetical protein